jgi:PPOX class probable F420-dependent enzyme
MAGMSPEQRDAFLGQPRIATLVTLYADGSPTAAPVWYEWDGERARIFTSGTSEKMRRIRRDPRVCLSVEEPAGVPEAWVTIEGDVEIRDRGAFELAQRLAPLYYGPAKAGVTLREWGRVADSWVLLEIVPRRIRSLAPE